MQFIDLADILSYEEDEEKVDLAFQKAKKGFGIEDELIWLGIANLAQYKWCDFKCLLKSYDEEELYLGAMLEDAFDLEAELIPSRITPETLSLLTNVFTDKNPMDFLMRKDGVSDELSELLIADYNSLTPKQKGVVDQYRHAEKYPTTRWFFKWDKYIIAGVPDGIGSDFAYEFKSTGSQYLFDFVLPTAVAQANLYACFFKLPKIRVQIYIRDVQEVKSINQNAEYESIIEILQNFKSLVLGEASPLFTGKTVVSRAGREWKCETCEYQEECRDVQKAFSSPPTPYQ